MFTKTAHLLRRSVRYLESGSGRPVVLLHAFPLSADQWLPQLHRAPHGVRLIAPDLIGFRSATMPAMEPGAYDLGALTLDDYAADVLEFMSHVDAERATVVGLSMGGYVAFAMWRRAPSRVTGLVLADTRAGSDTEEGRAGRDRMAALARQEGPAAVAAQLVPKLLGATASREQPDLADAVTQLILANSGEAIAGALLAIKSRPDSSPLLASITVPTTIVCGDEDVITPPAESEAMHRAIVGSRLLLVPRAGHLSNLEAPAVWDEAWAG